MVNAKLTLKTLAEIDIEWISELLIGSSIVYLMLAIMLDTEISRLEQAGIWSIGIFYSLATQIYLPNKWLRTALRRLWAIFKWLLMFVSTIFGVLNGVF
ncbi:hypothetical protein SAMN04487947_1208 [Halogeometricum rufum]|uniref:Uncharacterized protein n=1 Tax=Halogeometricum rufum TaxID=553469 RepID=A0A1I6GIS7_9EURY|nr:hypothetical protein SAMN04487947_1208 [Halogeometricum rufum]